MLLWCNGEIIKDSLAVHPQERGLLLGDGLFETLCVLGGKPLWLDAHLARMADAAQALGFMFSESEIRQGIAAVLAQFTDECGVLRITLTRGVAARGLAGEGEKPVVMVSLASFATSNFYQPCRLKLSAIRRNATAPTSRYKTTSYMDAIAAAREVAAVADDALMLNTAGFVACSSIANIFVLQGDRLITPARDQGILPGIMRAVFLDRARAGYNIEERPVEMAEVMGADFVGLTNSLRFMRPVSSVDNKPLDIAAGAALLQLMRKCVAAEAGLMSEQG